MTEFENIVIGKSAVPSLAATVILMAAIPVIFFLYWRRKHKEQTKTSFLPLAILLHMLMDIFPALYQRGAVPLWSVEVWAALCTTIVVFIAVRLSLLSEAE